jgi:hypothetical protein
MLLRMLSIPLFYTNSFVKVIIVVPLSLDCNVKLIVKLMFSLKLMISMNMMFSFSFVDNVSRNVKFMLLCCERR